MFPQCPFYPQVHGEAAWLVQAVHCNSNYCKLLFIGVKESVNAVTARAIRGDTLECGAERFQPARDQAIRRGYKALSGPYGVGSVYYPGLLEEIVCGDSPDELARSAAPLFKRMDVPSLDVWMPLFWDISVQAGFATPLDTWGIPHDVWRLRLPEPGIFLPLLEQHLPELSSLAEMTHAAQAA